MLAAGLYPNVARVNRIEHSRKSGHRLAFTTQRDEVFVHPGSVNANRPGLGPPHEGWLAYHEKQRTSKLWLYDSTVVPPNSLLLFGGKMRYEFETKTLSIDRWIEFKAPPARCPKATPCWS